MNLAQLLAVTRSEIKLHWRGRALIVITLSMLFCVIATILVVNSEDALAAKFTSGISAGEDLLTNLVIFIMWAPVGVAMVCITPVLVADAIPRDQQIGARELLDSLPMSRSTYLLGKLLGVWFSLFLAMGLVMVAGGITAYLTLGAFDLFRYLEMWVVGVGGVIVMNAGLGVLIAVGQPNRRRAVGLVIVLIFVLPFMFGADQAFSSESTIGLINPLRGAVISYYLLIGNVTSQQLAFAIIAGLVQVVVVGVLAWGWLRWQDQRA